MCPVSKFRSSGLNRRVSTYGCGLHSCAFVLRLLVSCFGELDESVDETYFYFFKRFAVIKIAESVELPY